MTGRAGDGLWTASKAGCVTSLIYSQSYKKLQGGGLRRVISWSSRATSEYDSPPVEELVRHPGPMTNVNIATTGVTVAPGSEHRLRGPPPPPRRAIPRASARRGEAGVGAARPAAGGEGCGEEGGEGGVGAPERVEGMCRLFVCA